jgi:hypothetical protein
VAPIGTGFGFKAREDATSVAAARAEEIHGSLGTKEHVFFDVRISREDMGSQWKPAVDHGMQHIFPQLQVI